MAGFLLLKRVNDKRKTMKMKKLRLILKKMKKPIFGPNADFLEKKFERFFGFYSRLKRKALKTIWISISP